MDSCRGRLNVCDPPEGPTDCQYEDILLQALPPEHKAVRHAHLERGDFGLAGIRRMVVPIDADSLTRSRSDSFRGIAGRGASMQTMTRDGNDVKCHSCGSVGHFQDQCLLRVKQQQHLDGQRPHQREERQKNQREQHQPFGGHRRGPVWCSYHKTTTHGDPDCCAWRRKRNSGNAHIAATGPWRIRESAVPTILQ